MKGTTKFIPIRTPKGTFRVRTIHFPGRSRTSVLILHGGPGSSHQYLRAFERYFPEAGIDFYYYDQLGSWGSDQPDEPSLWQLDRFVDELDQVQNALGLSPANLCLYGHSWGGILALEYATVRPNRQRALIISNMMASIPEYNRYAHEVMMPQIDPTALAEIQRIEANGGAGSRRYERLLTNHYYVHHLLRRAHRRWPLPVRRDFAHINNRVYVPMQGPSELGASGTLENWDRTADLKRIAVPTLCIGAAYDTMDPRHMEWMAHELPNGRYLHCPHGSHLAMYDDPVAYFPGLIEFVRGLDS